MTMNLIDKLKSALHSANTKNAQELHKVIRSLNISLDEVSPFIKQPSELEYGRNVIFSNDYAEVIIVYLPSFAKTFIHDHGSSAGSLFIIQGKLLNIIYDKTDEGIQFSKTESYEENDGFLVQGETIHMMYNPTFSPVISFHVYTPPLQNSTSYPSN